jgi:hypothetical protein
MPCCICPDYVVKQAGTAGIDPARIVDATNRDFLVPIIRAILPAHGERLPTGPQVHRFLGDVLQLVPEVHAVVGEAHALYTRLSGGLAEWARRIECEPFRCASSARRVRARPNWPWPPTGMPWRPGGARFTFATTGPWPTTSP